MNRNPGNNNKNFKDHLNKLEQDMFYLLKYLKNALDEKFGYYLKINQLNILEL